MTTKTKKQVLTLLNKGLKVKSLASYNHNTKQWEFTSVKTSKEYRENFLDKDDFLSIYTD